MRTQLQTEYIAIRKQIIGMRPDITPTQIDAMVRTNLPESPSPMQWVSKISELHALVLAAYNNPPEEEVIIDLPSVGEYFGSVGEEE